MGFLRDTPATPFPREAICFRCLPRGVKPRVARYERWILHRRDAPSYDGAACYGYIFARRDADLGITINAPPNRDGNAVLLHYRFSRSGCNISNTIFNVFHKVGVAYAHIARRRAACFACAVSVCWAMGYGITLVLRRRAKRSFSEACRSFFAITAASSRRALQRAAFTPRGRYACICRFLYGAFLRRRRDAARKSTPYHSWRSFRFRKE